MGVVGAIAGAVIQSRSAKKAANAQTAAADRQIAYQEETRDIVRGDLAPYREGGELAYGALQNMLGLGAAPMVGGTAPQIETYQIPGAYTPGRYVGGGGSDDSSNRGRYLGGSYGEPTTGYRVNGQNFTTLEEAQAFANANRTGGQEWSWQTDPGYQFRLDQGLGAIESSRAAKGGLYSGAAMRDALQYGQDYASQEFGNVYNRLAGVAQSGLGAAQMSGNASMQTAGNVGNALGAMGNAQAAGYIGQGNAWNNGIGNALGIMNYQNNMNNGGSGGNNWLFGGNSWGM